MGKIFGFGDRSVVRVTVDNYYLEVAEDLTAEVGKERGEILFLIQGRDDDREPGGGHF